MTVIVVDTTSWLVGEFGAGAPLLWCWPPGRLAMAEIGANFRRSKWYVWAAAEGRSSSQRIALRQRALGDLPTLARSVTARSEFESRDTGGSVFIDVAQIDPSNELAVDAVMSRSTWGSDAGLILSADDAAPIATVPLSLIALAEATRSRRRPPPDAMAALFRAFVVELRDLGAHPTLVVEDIDVVRAQVLVAHPEDVGAVLGPASPDVDLKRWIGRGVHAVGVRSW